MPSLFRAMRHAAVLIPAALATSCFGGHSTYPWTPDADGAGDGDADADEDGDADADADADDDAVSDADDEPDAEVDCSYTPSPVHFPEEPIWLEGAVPFPDGSFVVIGTVRGTAVFGDDELTVETDERELFFARFSRDGDLQWVERTRGYFQALPGLPPQGTSCDQAYPYYPSMAQGLLPVLALADGSLLLGIRNDTGGNATVVLGVGGDEEVLEIIAGSGPAYLVKYLPSGERQLVLEIYGLPLQATSDGGWLADNMIRAIVTGDPLVLDRFDADGELLWSLPLSENFRSPALVAGPDGSLVLHGNLHEWTGLDEALVPVGCDASQADDVSFAARIGGDGEVLWSRCLGHGWAIGDLVVTDDDAVVVTAEFDASDFEEGVAFGPDDAATVWDGADQQGVLLARIGADGANEWIHQALGYVDGRTRQDFPHSGESLRDDGTAMLGADCLTASLGEGEHEMPAGERCPSLAGFDQAGELAWVGCAAGYHGRSMLSDLDSTTVFWSSATLLEPFVLTNGADGIVSPAAGAYTEVALAAMDRDGEPLWSQRIGRGRVLVSSQLLAVDEAFLEVALLAGESELGYGAGATTVGADGRIVIGAGRIESDGTLAWARTLVSAPDSCPPESSRRFPHLFDCPNSIETLADVEPYVDWGQYDDVFDEVRRRPARWIDPSCFRVCDSAWPGDLCWEAHCTTAVGTVIDASGTQASWLEGTGLEQQAVDSGTSSLSIAPPAGAEDWSLIELGITYAYRTSIYDDPRSGESLSGATARWVGTIDPCWPSSYAIEQTGDYQHDEFLESGTLVFSHEQCEVERHWAEAYDDLGSHPSSRTSVNGHGMDCVGDDEDEVCTIF